MSALHVGGVVAVATLTGGAHAHMSGFFCQTGIVCFPKPSGVPSTCLFSLSSLMLFAVVYCQTVDVHLCFLVTPRI